MAGTSIPSDFQGVLRPHLPFADSLDLSGERELAALGLDSMSLVALLADLEDHYDVQLPDDIVQEAAFFSVGSLWSALEPLVESGGDRA